MIIPTRDRISRGGIRINPIPHKSMMMFICLADPLKRFDSAYSIWETAHNTFSLPYNLEKLFYASGMAIDVKFNLSNKPPFKDTVCKFCMHNVSAVKFPLSNEPN